VLSPFQAAHAIDHGTFPPERRESTRE